MDNECPTERTIECYTELIFSVCWVVYKKEGLRRKVLNEINAKREEFETAEVRHYMACCIATITARELQRMIGRTVTFEAIETLCIEMRERWSEKFSSTRRQEILSDRGAALCIVRDFLLRFMEPDDWRGIQAAYDTMDRKAREQGGRMVLRKKRVHIRERKLTKVDRQTLMELWYIAISVDAKLAPGVGWSKHAQLRLNLSVEEAKQALKEIRASALQQFSKCTEGLTLGTIDLIKRDALAMLEGGGGKFDDL